ncbi:hypothetical protein QJS10_CPB14g01187 [Acorus calamus]|uniref:Bulb-type lectin domain-containing protein n=1 Tax=Acorus calamus TaxID=4465 RepID=A0AAV9DBN7_ACOCL|nr:hypothetical protein QJS10_CPB14g01187 [Acorus calamus]
MVYNLVGPPCEAANVLFSGDTLRLEESLTYGNYRLTMQRDCNLVLYDGGRAVWASGTNGKGSGCYLRMQYDANLVVYNYDGKSLWSSKTYRRMGNYLVVLQNDRNVVIYGDAFWDSKTYVPMKADNGHNATLVNGAGYK